jgi:hypothetical protein
MEAKVDEVKNRWSAKIGVARSMYNTYKAAKKMEKDMANEEMKDKGNEESKEERKDEMKPGEMENMKAMSENMIDVAWSITVYDIETTLRAAIDKLFKDKAVDKKGKERRARGLKTLGNIYKKYGENSDNGIKEMKKTIAMQMKGQAPEADVNEGDYDFCNDAN